MRVDRLRILHYGPLAARELDFSAGREGLHVFYGSNEWGKSLSLQALEHALFSIPRKVGGFSEAEMLQLELELAISRRVGKETQQLVFRRRRQSLAPADAAEPVEERHIQAYLGGVTAETFRQSYGLSAERIREGGRLLQTAKGDIADTLFAAATGVERIRAVGESIASRWSGLYSASGNAVKPELNTAIRGFRQGFANFSAAVQSPEAIVRLQRQLEDAEAEFRAVEAQLDGLSARSTHLGRLQAVQSSAGQLHAARRRLADLGTPPLLAETFRTRLDEARAAVTRVATLMGQATNGLTDLRRRREAISVADEVLAAADTINALLEATGELHTIDNDLPRRLDDIQRRSMANEGFFRDIAATTGRRARETASQSSETLKQIESLIEEHGAIVTACDERARQLDAASQRLDSLESGLATRAAVEDIGDLRDRLTTIRDAGDLEKAVATKRDGFAAAEMEYAVTARRLYGRRCDRPAEELQPPSLEEVRDYRERFRGVERAADEIDSTGRELAAEIRTLESRIALLEQQAALPEEGELERVRGERDARIETVGRAAAGGDLPASDAASRFGEIARLIEKADSVADQLRIHAGQVTERTQHRLSIEGLRTRLEQLDKERARLVSRTAALEQAWSDLWQPAQVVPKAPVAMEAWLATHAECLKQAGGLRQLGREIDSLERHIEDDRLQLVAILSRFGVAPAADAGRRQLIDQATAAIDRRRAQAVERAQLVAQIGDCRQDVSRLDALLAESTRKRDTWNHQWAECMAVLDQPADTSHVTGRFLLDTMRQVAANEVEIGNIRTRIAKMEARRSAIHELMRQVCSALDQPFDTAGVQELSRVASERLRASQTAIAQRKTIDQQIAEIERAIDRLRQDRVDAEAVLTTLRAESRVDDDAGLDAAWERSRRFRELMQLVDGWEQEFLQKAGHADHQALMDQCLATTAEAIEQELSDIQRQSQILRDQRDEIRDRQKGLATQVNALGGDRAAQAAAECRAHEAEVVARVREYIPLRLATLALARASRRYRDEHHAPVLSRASDLFRRITGGRYTAIRLADNDLYAVRSDSNAESVLQRYMSEGTRDQVYLALRLASLEHAHKQAEPLPLILDDGLVHFDDDRTAAMLAVLADISAGMQVILFTHHRSVMDAARMVQAAMPHSVFLHGEVALLRGTPVAIGAG